MAMVTIDNVLHLPYPVRDSSPSSMVPVGMTRPRGSRVRKARDLFAKVRIKRRSLFLVEAYIMSVRMNRTEQKRYGFSL